MTETVRHQQGHLLSENFGNWIAKDSFRGRIREPDDAVLIDADDGVRRSLCNDAEQFTGFVGCAIVIHGSPSDVFRYTRPAAGGSALPAVCVEQMGYFLAGMWSNRSADISGDAELG